MLLKDCNAFVNMEQMNSVFRSALKRCSIVNIMCYHMQIHKYADIFFMDMCEIILFCLSFGDSAVRAQSPWTKMASNNHMCLLVKLISTRTHRWRSPQQQQTLTGRFHNYTAQQLNYAVTNRPKSNSYLGILINRRNNRHIHEARH